MGDQVLITSTLSENASLQDTIRWLKAFADTVQSASGRNLIQDVKPSGAALSTLNNAVAGQVPYFTGPTSVALGAVGTWTPTLQGSTTAGAPTYTTQVGSYEQLGRLVVARFTIVTTALGAPAGNMQIGGLPIASANVPNDNGNSFISLMSGVTLDAGYQTLTGIVLPNTNVVQLFELGSGVAGQATGVGRFAAATTLEGAVFYHF